MARKPSYEELEERVKELEEKSREHGKTEEQMALFRKFTEASGQGLGMADLEGRVIYANPTLCRLMGEESPEDPIGKNVRTYYSEEELPILENEILPAVFKDGQKTAEISLQSLKGELTPTIQNVFLIRNDKGRPVYLANVITDITERKQAERELERHRDHLEDLVAVRTREVGKRNEELRREITERMRVETALGESEARYRRITEAVTDYVFTVRAENGIPVETLHSPACIAVTGYGPDEYASDPHLWIRMVHEEDRARVADQAGRVLSGEDVRSIEHRIYRKDGTVRWVRNTLVPHYDREHKVVGYDGVVSDITERKRAEEALRESEAALKSIFRAAPTGIGLVSNRILKRVNERICEMIGYSEEELVEQSARILYPTDEDFEYVGREKYAQIRDRGTGTVETRWQRKDGEVIDVLLSSTPLDPNNLSAGVTFTALDITERKQAEEVLRTEKEKFEILVEKSPLAVSLIGEDGGYEYVNPKFVEMFGYALEDIPNGRVWFQKAYPDPEYRREVISAWKRDLKGSKIGEARLKAFTVNCKDGSEKVIQFRPVSMHDGSELVIYEDITAQKRLEARVRQAQKMEAIGTLAGGIAHDFNNLLTPIIVHAEIAEHVLPDDSPVRHNVGKVVEAGYRARDLVRQILAFSRQRERQRTPLSISPILQETLKLLRASLPTTVEMSQKTEIESDVVLADAIDIHQILLNLCTNAAHAMREKGGVLEVSLVDVELDAQGAAKYGVLEPGAYVRLAVSDTGHGIDRAIIDRIFDPFFTTKAPGEGTGMGLSVVHGIVQSYRGAITVESDPGRGTTFRVLLPKADKDVLGSPEPAGPMPTGSERILLVDDDKAMVDAVRLMLEYLGYSVVASISSLEALEMFREQPDQFDLVITDQTMPKMTGKDLAQALIHIRSDIPIVLCTGFSEQVTAEEAHAIGISRYVMKPIIIDDMARIIREVVDKAKGSNLY